mmetsp:Transcript_10584/g.32533  ORF Transcript_10584/g.32533 Transcript_10584/m.32533 type:complete len:273 (-) Transcript_10584:263-1081(-)
MPCSYPLAVALSPEVTQRMCSGREMRARIPSYGRECGSITGLAAEHIVCVASLSALISLLLLLPPPPPPPPFSAAQRPTCGSERPRSTADGWRSRREPQKEASGYRQIRAPMISSCSRAHSSSPTALSIRRPPLCSKRGTPAEGPSRSRGQQSSSRRNSTACISSTSAPLGAESSVPATRSRRWRVALSSPPSPMTRSTWTLLTSQAVRLRCTTACRWSKCRRSPPHAPPLRRSTTTCPGCTCERRTSERSGSMLAAGAPSPTQSSLALTAA